MEFDAVIDTPCGRLGLAFRDDRLAELEPWLPPGTPLKPPASAAARAAAARLHAYLENPAAPLELPLAERGTPFQLRVWAALREIPAGTTLSYGELARRLGSSPRAVGQACRRNPIPIFTPCHRVVSAHGIGGYAGATAGGRLELKRWLLHHEQGGGRAGDDGH